MLEPASGTQQEAVERVRKRTGQRLHKIEAITRIWSFMQLERQLRPEALGRRRGGYLDRRRTRQ